MTYNINKKKGKTTDEGLSIIVMLSVLKEVMNGREILGCILVFSAVILAQIPGFIKK